MLILTVLFRAILGVAPFIFKKVKGDCFKAHADSADDIRYIPRIAGLVDTLVYNVNRAAQGLEISQTRWFQTSWSLLHSLRSVMEEKAAEGDVPSLKLYMVLKQSVRLLTALL